MSRCNCDKYNPACRCYEATTMTTFRDEIADIIERDTVVGIGLVDHQHEVGEVHDALPAADAILALIRERLTSDAAVEAAGAAMWTRHIAPGDPTWHSLDRDVKVMYREEARDAVTAALDAITGETR